MSAANTNINKPIPCNQNWNEMLPADGGRICLGCGKLVSDFRKKSWAEIAKAHGNSPIPVCGIYADAQLNRWGHDISVRYVYRNKLITYSAALLAFIQLSPTTINAQKLLVQEQSHANKNATQHKPTNSKLKSKIVSGTIVVLQSDSTKLPLKGVSVFILQDSLHLKTTTDSAGRFVISTADRFNKLPNILSLILSHPDFITKSVKLNKNNLKVLDFTFSQINIDSKIVPLIDRGTSFYARERNEEVVPPVKKKWWQFWKRN